jgi:hypothetical protein
MKERRKEEVQEMDEKNFKRHKEKEVKWRK